MPKYIELLNKKFNKLTVISNNDKKDKYNKILVECKCDCGNIKYISKRCLVNGTVQSCGCYHKLAPTKHGMFGTPLYKVYDSMIQRCYNLKSQPYHNYGGRGILVCDEWKTNSSLFLNWAKNNGYKNGLQLDRINVNGNYEPYNCRFITAKENCRNKRNNRYIEYNGLIKPMVFWSEFFNIKYAIFSRKVKKYGSIKEIPNL